MTSAMLEAYVRTNLNAATKPRGDWRHLSCPSCGDRGTHLGLNIRTGHIVCIRCGLASHATWIDKSAVFKHVRKEDPEFNSYYTHGAESNMSMLDHDIAEYAASRKMDISDNQLAFGRRGAVGCLVFIQYDANETPIYIQWRSLQDHMYRAIPNTRPRLNMYGRSDILVLTEGPVDAIRVRMATGLWTSPLCSTKMDANYNIDILMANPRMVIIMMDNDDAGRGGAPKVALKLTQMGINNRVVHYSPSEPKDAGDMTDDQIVKVISRCITAE